MKVKLVYTPIFNQKDGENIMPKYQTPGSAGFDFMANITEPLVLESGQIKIIKTGMKTALPHGYELQVRSRSGLAAKHGIFVFNSPGTIDEDYTNEIGVILMNASNVPFTIEPGMRIAQGVLAKYEQCEWELVDELLETDRKGGFGSTGN